MDRKGEKARTKGKVWKVINRKSKKKGSRQKRKIEMQECEEYFKTQLGEEDKKVVSDVELDRENDEETLEKKRSRRL